MHGLHLVMRKYQKTQAEDNLQNNWPVSFKVLKEISPESTEVGYSKYPGVNQGEKKTNRNEKSTIIWLRATQIDSDNCNDFPVST